LLDLVWLRIVAVPLKIDSLLYACLAKEMMTTVHPFHEAQAFQQSAQVIEANRRIGISAENPSQRLRGTQTNIVLRRDIVTKQTEIAGVRTPKLLDHALVIPAFDVNLYT